MAALALMSGSPLASLLMTESWQLVLMWGVVSGIGSGCVARVLSATIVNRWFVSNRGLVMGLLAVLPLDRHTDFLSCALSHAGIGWLEAGGDHGCRGDGAADPAGLSCSCRNGRPMLAKSHSVQTSKSPRRCARRANPLKTAFGALERRREEPRFLAAGGHLLCLRLHHQWTGRHAHDRAVRRSWPGRGGGRWTAGDDGHCLIWSAPPPRAG